MKDAQLQLALAPTAARIYEAMVLAGQSVLSGRRKAVAFAYVVSIAFSRLLVLCRRLRRIRGQKRGHTCSSVDLYHALVAFCMLLLRLDLSVSSDQFGRGSDQWWEAA